MRRVDDPRHWRLACLPHAAVPAGDAVSRLHQAAAGVVTDAEPEALRGDGRPTRHACARAAAKWDLAETGKLHCSVTMYRQWVDSLPGACRAASMAQEEAHSRGAGWNAKRGPRAENPQPLQLRPVGLGLARYVVCCAPPHLDRSARCAASHQWGSHSTAQKPRCSPRQDPSSWDRHDPCACRWTPCTGATRPYVLQAWELLVPDKVAINKDRRCAMPY
jgi:hypothetical protein